MSFTSIEGYIPRSIESLMDLAMEGINTQFGTSYTTDTFLGTNWYKYFYALIQLLQENEVKTSEIFAKLQEYFNTTNSMIQRPQTTAPGIIDVFAAAGYLVSVKAPIDADAGKAYICVDVDSGASDYAAQKLAIATLIKDCVVAGVVTQGTESTNITLSNNQSFDFKYNLPSKIPIKLRLTNTLSVNNLFAVDQPADVKQRLFDNINERYSLGKNFEPERYYSIIGDAPWASIVLLEWSTDSGSNWHSTVFSAAYNEIYTFALSDITLVEV
jgi:hypothetical protein